MSEAKTFKEEIMRGRNSNAVFEEILRNEDANSGYIYLHHNGIFWRAYNQSAYLYNRFVNDKYKVSCKYIQKYNRYILAVGMPVEAVVMLQRKYQVDVLNGGLFLIVRVPFVVNGVEYAGWEDAHRLSVKHSDRYTRLTSLIENQPVWKVAWDMLMSVLDVGAHVNKRYVDPAAMEARRNAYLLTEGLLFFYEAADRKAAADTLCVVARKVIFALQVLNAKEQCSDDRFSENMERLSSICGQLQALAKPSEVAK